VELGGSERKEEEKVTLYAFPTKFLQSAQQELLKLYDFESGKFVKVKSTESKYAFPPCGSIGGGGLGKFSTYFQALLEFVLAASEYQQKFHGSSICSSTSSSGTLVRLSNVTASSGGPGSSGSSRMGGDPGGWVLDGRGR